MLIFQMGRLPQNLPQKSHFDHLLIGSWWPFNYYYTISSQNQRIFNIRFVIFQTTFICFLLINRNLNKEIFRTEILSFVQWMGGFVYDSFRLSPDAGLINLL